jgi:gluconolactonase
MDRCCFSMDLGENQVSECRLKVDGHDRDSLVQPSGRDAKRGDLKVIRKDGRDPTMQRTLSRRQFVGGVAGAFTLGGAEILASGAARAQSHAELGTPPTVITSPPRQFGPGAASPIYFNDPDILTIDPSFNAYVQPNAAIVRLWTGAGWSEGPAWSAEGRYLVWSDIPNNRQLRWLEDEGGRVHVFRYPSNYSNGNTFDFQGRQLSCEHLTRRVVRYDLDGSVKVIADNYNGKRLNSPNDIVPHPDGSLWFTDPPYGGSLYEGEPDAAGGSTNASGKFNPRLGQPAGFTGYKRELPTNVYRVDASGKVEMVVPEQQLPDPNGILFSPDYKRLYVISTGKGPGDNGPGGKGNIYVFDVGPDNRPTNQKLFTDCVVDGIKCGPDGMRCDVDGNVWCSSNAGRNVGYNGVTIWNPSGKLIGRIRLPEVVANIAFGGPKRNRLFIAASTSLYAVYVNTQGAAPG